MSVTTAQATTLLENVLFESATIAEQNAPSWAAQSASTTGEGTLSGLAAAMAATPEAGIVQQVVRYYLGALGRVPGGAEIQFYTNVVEAGLSAAQIAQGATAVPGAEWTQISEYFTASPEFAKDFGLSSPGAINANNEAPVIFAFYSNILGRVPTQSEVTYYENLLNSGTSVSTLVQYFTTSPEYQNSIDSSINTALAANGVAASSGVILPTIPLAPPGQTLGSTPLVITGTATTTAENVVGTPAATAQAAVTAVAGVIGVAGVTASTGVQPVTAVTAVNPIAGQTAVTAVTDGSVTINDAAFTATGAGTITSVILANSGAGSAINDNALTSLTLIGTTGTVALDNINSAAITAHNSTLSLVLNGLSAPANTITDTNSEIATLNVTTLTADSTLAGFSDAHLKTLTVTGANKLTLLSINGSLTALTVSGGAGFSDGATLHGSGLSTLGGNLTITDTSAGVFAAALDDTTQTFTGSSGADTIIVSDLADATKTITAGSATSNEIIFEGGAYSLTSASSGKFVNFQTVGVAGDVTGNIDLSVVDPTASTFEVLGATNGITFVKAASGAGLLIDASAGATVTLIYADSTGAKDTTAITMSSNVASLTLQDSAGVGVGTVGITNNLAAAETSVSAAHVISVLTDNGLATLNVSGTAGLSITTLNETATPAASFTLNNTSTDGFGVTIGTLNDAALATLAFMGAGVSTVSAVNSSAASLSVTNGGTGLNYVGAITDNNLTSLTLAANVSLGQAASAQTTIGLQDGSTAGVTIAGGSDNAHVTVNLSSGAASGKTDAITLGNGNNIVIDDSVAGTVNVTLGSGANLVELGGASLDTTAKYNVTFTARGVSSPNAVFVGAAGTNFASAPNLVVTGATTGDIIAFGNDPLSSNAALTATSLASATSVANALTTLEAALTVTHAVAYGVYGGNTYIVESETGVVGATDTAVIEVTGAQTLTASTGYVTLGNTASTLSTGGLSGSGFTIPAGTATNITLGAGANIVTLVGPSAGVSDTFTSSASSTGLTANYQATSGTDTIFMNGSAGANASDIGTLTVNDTSSSNAGLIIGAFTDNGLTSVTYNNSTATGGTVTQQALTSSSLTSVNFTGGVTGQATNSYFFSGNLTTSKALTINDSNIGSGSTIIGLNLAGGPPALTVNMTGPGKLATGALSDNNLLAMNITGSGTGQVNIGTLTDTAGGAGSTFTVTDNSSSTGSSVIVLSGLSAAIGLTVNDSSAGALTDNNAPFLGTISDGNLAALTLTNSGAGTLTLGSGGVTANALSSISVSSTGTGGINLGAGGISANSLTSIGISGSGTGGITLGTLTDTGSSALQITDTSSSKGTMSLALDNVSAATGITVTDSSAGPLNLGNVNDNSLGLLSLTNTGSSTLGVTSIADAGAGPLEIDYSSNSVNALTLPFTAAAVDVTGFTVKDSARANLTIGAFTDDSATSLTFTNTGTGTLTVSGVTDTQATINLAIAGSGTGTENITVTDVTAGAQLAITDSSSSSGMATIAANVAQVSVTNNGASASNITLTDSAAAPVAVTLAGTGNQNLILTDLGGTISVTGTGVYAVTLPAALNVISLPAAAAGNANSTPVTADSFKSFQLDTAAIGDTIHLGFTASNIITNADLNSGTTFWTANNGMLVKAGASVLNFVAEVQSLTTAGGAAASGIAGFYDGANTWIAYNDHSGTNVAVVELVGVQALGIEAAATTAGFVHIS